MAEQPQLGHEMKGERHTFLIYDAASGQVVHGHKELILPYGPRPSLEEVTKRALELAAKVTGRGASSLKLIEVSEEELQPGSIFRVDPKSGRLQREAPKGR